MDVLGGARRVRDGQEPVHYLEEHDTHRPVVYFLVYQTFFQMVIAEGGALQRAVCWGRVDLDVPSHHLISALCVHGHGVAKVNKL